LYRCASAGVGQQLCSALDSWEGADAKVASAPNRAAEHDPPAVRRSFAGDLLALLDHVPLIISDARDKGRGRHRAHRDDLPHHPQRR
jgi:hypothetical protein